MSDTALPIERITPRILLVRGRKVLLDRDLAEFYGVETKTLIRALMDDSTPVPPSREIGYHVAIPSLDPKKPKAKSKAAAGAVA